MKVSVGFRLVYTDVYSDKWSKDSGHILERTLYTESEVQVATRTAWVFTLIGGEISLDTYQGSIVSIILQNMALQLK